MPPQACTQVRMVLSQVTTSQPTSVNSAASPPHHVSGQKPKRCSAAPCPTSGLVAWHSATSQPHLARVSSEWLQSRLIILPSRRTPTLMPSSNNTASFPRPTVLARVPPLPRPTQLAQHKTLRSSLPQHCRLPPTTQHVRACKTR